MTATIIDPNGNRESGNKADAGLAFGLAGVSPICHDAIEWNRIVV
jgi:hypothetical protein